MVYPSEKIEVKYKDDSIEDEDSHLQTITERSLESTQNSQFVDQTLINDFKEYKRDRSHS